MKKTLLNNEYKRGVKMEEIILYGSKSKLLKVIAYLKKKFVLGRVHKYIVIGCSDGLVKDIKRKGLDK